MDISKHFEKYSLNADIIVLLDDIFWLLDLVLWDPASIPDLSVEYQQRSFNMSGIDQSALVYLETGFNRSWHGLSEEELIEAFLYLSSNDLIFCERYWNISPRHPETKRCILDRKTLKSVLDPRNRDLELMYGLTSKGGELWESITSANWGLNFSMTRTLLGYENNKRVLQCEIEGSDRALIEQFIAENRWVNPDDLADVIWEKVSLQPIYWKTLPHAYRANYLGSVPSQEEIQRREASGMLTNVTEWYISPLEREDLSQGTYGRTGGVIHNYEIASENVYVHLGYANLLERQGRPEEAAKHYLRALEVNPEHADAHKNYAALLDKQGRTEEAKQHHQRALEIDPST